MLSSLDPQNGHAIASNSTFESIFGPLFKFKEWDFADAASEDYHPSANSGAPTAEGGDEAARKETNRSRFRDAIEGVRRSLRCGDASGEGGGSRSSAKIRNVEMLTLGTNDAGLPVRVHFDWNIGSVKLDDDSSAVIMYGDMVNEAESSDR